MVASRSVSVRKLPTGASPTRISVLRVSMSTAVAPMTTPSAGGVTGGPQAGRAAATTMTTASARMVTSVVHPDADEEIDAVGGQVVPTADERHRDDAPERRVDGGVDVEVLAPQRHDHVGAHLVIWRLTEDAQRLEGEAVVVGGAGDVA